MFTLGVASSNASAPLLVIGPAEGSAVVVEETRVEPGGWNTS